MIVSGSSLLQLREGDADLSRRAIKYTMPGLSFREALRFYHGLSFPRWSLDDILVHPYDLWQTVTSKCKPVALFKEYLEKGYYPFLLEGEGEYYTKIEQVVNYIIETQLPRICKVDVANVRKLQALCARPLPLAACPSRTMWNTVRPRATSRLMANTPSKLAVAARTFRKLQV